MVEQVSDQCQTQLLVVVATADNKTCSDWWLAIYLFVSHYTSITTYYKNHLPSIKISLACQTKEEYNQLF